MSDDPSRLDYVAPVFRVADLARSLSYYRDQLGFEVEFNYEGFYAGVFRDGCRIHALWEGSFTSKTPTAMSLGSFSRPKRHET